MIPKDKSDDQLDNDVEGVSDGNDTGNLSGDDHAVAALVGGGAAAAASAAALASMAVIMWRKPAVGTPASAVDVGHQTAGHVDSPLYESEGRAHENPLFVGDFVS